MRFCYTAKKFQRKSLDLICLCNKIIEEFTAEGYELTLRQIYYQIVARDWFPDDRKFRWTGRAWVKDPSGTKNAEPNYDMLGELLNDARLAGLVDWEAIIDRTRNVRALQHWDEPSSIVADSAKAFNYDAWNDQRNRVEVWIEKDALVGVIGGTCAFFDVPYFSCRGYTSQSEMWGAAQRFMNYYERDGAEEVIVIHLGDHDPSGLDMTRDIGSRLQLFCETHGFLPPTIERIALNMPQIRQYNPPPNPTKLTDCRAEKYVAEHGYESWELDALNPKVITKLVADSIESFIDDRERFDEIRAEQKEKRKELAKIANNYDRVIKHLNKKAKHNGRTNN